MLVPIDHLYRYGWFEIQQDIAVRYPKLSAIFIIMSYGNTLSLVTLNVFKGRISLRCVTYKQDSLIVDHRNKIFQNAFLLFD